MEGTLLSVWKTPWWRSKLASERRKPNSLSMVWLEQSLWVSQDPRGERSKPSGGRSVLAKCWLYHDEMPKPTVCRKRFSPRVGRIIAGRVDNR